jgi:DNA invertase Pin-like site-specific DNA recombinase
VLSFADDDRARAETSWLALQCTGSPVLGSRADHYNVHENAAPRREIDGSLHAVLLDMTTRAIGYVRVSTDEQATLGVSLQAQEAKLHAWASLHDVDITIEVDAGISGKSIANRPALGRALDAIRARRATCLVVCDLSRLSRTTRHALEIAELLAKRGAELVSLREQIPGGPAGKLILTVLAALAELERSNTALRTSAALQHKKSRGERVGSVPLGFALVAGALVPDEREQAVIAQARELRAAGMSLREVASALDERGLRTRTGRAWLPAQVARMLACAA